MELKNVTSSNINKVGYENGILQIVFKDKGVYNYKDVPENIFTDLLKSLSIGSFFHRNIKNVFDFDKED